MLKKMTAACICFMVCAGTVSAQERYTVDKVVAVVGNSAIKYSELVEARNVLVEERRKQGYTSDRDPMNEALEGLLVQKLLYNQALIDSVQINLDAVSSEVEARLAMMTEEAGSTAALEAEMGMPYYEIRQDFKGKYEEMYYAQAMRSDVISKVKITPGEVEMFYREARPGQPAHCTGTVRICPDSALSHLQQGGEAARARRAARHEGACHQRNTFRPVGEDVLRGPRYGHAGR